MSNNNWISVADRLPPMNVVVETKIDDENGCRNVQPLQRYQRWENTRILWFFPDMSMYVYYTPTHWRYLP